MASYPGGESGGVPHFNKANTDHVEQMNAKYDERTEFLRDVLIIACEGGINYWADVIRYTPQANGTAVVRELDSGEPVELRLDGPVIETGIAKILSGKVKINSDIWKFISYASTHNDASDIDAEGADCIVQVALLGEIVYG